MQPPQRRLFNRLAAFAGSWTLEAAENVCGAAGIDPAEVLELLGTLVDQSLVVVEEESGRVRYRLLEPMRQYAAQKLEEWGESQLIRDLHRDWFLAQAERSPFELMDPEHVVWLGEEIDNMRAALRWSIQQGVVEPGLRLARAAGAYWYQRGFYSEGRAWLAELLALQLGDTQMARRHFRENLALAQASGDTSELAWSLEGLAGALLHTQPDHAVRLAAAASTLRETLGARPFPWERELLDRWLTAAAVRIGEEAYRAAWAEGRALPPDQMFGLAGAEHDEQEAQPPRAKQQQIDELSLREREVVRLVARGRTNRQIAEQLVIAPRTADTHVGNILTKLGLHTRAELAVWAVAHGLTPLDEASASTT